MMLLCANPLCCSSVLLLCAAPSQLAICRALVEAMGGCIFVKSKPRVGSCFSFAIPLLLPPPLAPSCGGAVKGVGRISSHVSNLEAAVALEMPPFPSSVHYSRTESTLPVGPVWGGGKERRRGLVLVVEDDDMSYEVVSAFLDRLCFDNGLWSCCVATPAILLIEHPTMEAQMLLRCMVKAWMVPRRRSSLC